MEKKLKSPISTQLEITSNCNYLCKHCYNYWRYETTGQRHVKEKNNIPAITDSIIDAEVFHVVVTGGEPLFAFDRTASAISKLTKNNIQVNMNSNLALLNDYKAETLKDLGLNHVLTSVYSCHKQDNNYQMNDKAALEKTLRGSIVALNNGLSVSANMVVNKQNLNDVYRTGKFLFDKGLNGFNATRFVPAVKSQLEESLTRDETVHMLEQLQLLKDEGYRVGTLNPIAHCFEEGRFIELTQYRGCSAGVTSVGVGSDGDVRACQHTPVSYGNVLENSLSDIWKSIPYWKEAFLPDSCSSCSEKNSCGGGCRQYAKISSDDWKGKDPLFTKIQRNNREEKQINNTVSKVYEVQKGLLVRKEANGGVFFKNPGKYAVVDDFTYNLLLKHYGNALNTQKISNEYNIPLKTTQQLLGYLKKRGVLKPYKGGMK